jgi:hypothetical protein
MPQSSTVFRNPILPGRLDLSTKTLSKGVSSRETLPLKETSQPIALGRLQRFWGRRGERCRRLRSLRSFSLRVASAQACRSSAWRCLAHSLVTASMRSTISFGSSSRAMCAAMYRSKRSGSYQCALVGSHVRHLCHSGSVAETLRNSAPSQCPRIVSCGLKVVKLQAICTNRGFAATSKGHAVCGQRTVIRVPFCTSDGTTSRRILGLRRTGSISKVMR